MGWSAWYPTSAEPDPAPPKHFFDLGAVAHNGPIADTAKRPLVLLSHGTGGVTESLGWLARGLVKAGYITIGVNHHGNSGAEPYMAEGFMCWWERTADLTVLLDHMANDGSFAHVIDVDRVATVGFFPWGLHEPRARGCAHIHGRILGVAGVIARAIAWPERVRRYDG